jgi:hypothetical protein
VTSTHIESSSLTSSDQLSMQTIRSANGSSARAANTQAEQSLALAWTAIRRLERVESSARQLDHIENRPVGTVADLGASGLSMTKHDLVVGLQRWAGQIVSIDDGLLSAELHPLDHEGEVIVADFELRLLGPDASAARRGAVVYLTTRLIEDKSGAVEAMSRLRLRRTRQWSKKELDDTMSRARLRAASIGAHAKQRPAR